MYVPGRILWVVGLLCFLAGVIGSHGWRSHAVQLSDMLTDLRMILIGAGAMVLSHGWPGRRFEDAAGERRDASYADETA